MSEKISLKANYDREAGAFASLMDVSDASDKGERDGLALHPVNGSGGGAHAAASC